MSHRMTQIREYVFKALQETGAENIRLEIRGKHPAFNFEVRCPGGLTREGMFVFSSTPRIDKDLKVISQARRCVRELRTRVGGISPDHLVRLMTEDGHHPIMANLISRQYALEDRVAVDWVRSFLRKSVPE